jgi:hypothetical protein
MPKHSEQDIIAAFAAEGIPCQPHDLGLARYAVDPAAYARELRKILDTHPAREPAQRPSRPVCHGYANCCSCPDCSTRSDTTTLRVLTMDTKRPQPVPDCRDDPMTCDCAAHRAERVVAIKRGRRDVVQPWEPRTSRRAA